jgi:GDPmannose 4,6-dehydratase
VAEAFQCVGLDWQEHVVTETGLRRPSDIEYSASNPEKARRKLGWEASHGFKDVVRMLVQAERDRI